MSESWQTPEAWQGTFAFRVGELLDPQSELARKLPHLHQILQDRLTTTFAARGDHGISQCTHTNLPGFEGERSDGPRFQQQEDSDLMNAVHPIWDNSNRRAKHLCGNLTERMEVYGLVGAGSFACVYLARERGDSVDPDDLQHFAVKMERHTTMLGAKERHISQPLMAPILDHTQSLRYIPGEALVLLLLTNSDRFPKLNSVYTHDRFHAIVMSLCIDYASDRQPLQEGDFTRRFPGFTGRYLMTPDNKPLLNEVEVCKVAAQLLQGMVQMADMNLWHGDISVNNFVMDEQLNVQIIDLGDVNFGLNDADFMKRYYAYLPFQEYQMSPELARHLAENCLGDLEVALNPWVRLTHDVRQEALWKFGVILYGMLHGFWPWDNPPTGGHRQDLLNFNGSSNNQRVSQRRDNIMSMELPIDESLSQDCVDVLQAMFNKDPAERPSLAELETFPWFRQWAHEDCLFERPFSQVFQDHWGR